MTISCVLMGGIGNNLFQISTTIAHSLKYGCQHAISIYIQNPHYSNQKVIYSKKINYRSESIEGLHGRVNYYYEPHFHYKEIPQSDCDHYILVGYWQSAYFFQAYKKEILNLLELDNIGTKKGVCSIHYRSGDYNNLSNVHPKVTSEYLQSAISYMWLAGYKNFMVFSDNIPEIKELISSFPMYRDLDFQYSEGKSELEDLKEMASCSSNIISNSSFSWWAQYINPNENKIVVAPRIWFGRDMPHNTSDLYLPKWVVI